MKIAALVQNLIEAGAFQRVINDPLAQFGTAERAYLGAELMPEQTKPENNYVEELIEYRTIVANEGTRYSPAQKKSGVISGSFQVALGYQDTASEFTGQDYDALIRLVEQQLGRQGVERGDVARMTMEATTKLMNWSEATLRRPLIEAIERGRWQAIIDAQWVRTGDNGFKEMVNMSNPTGHRVTAGGTWSNNSYDPYTDLMALFEVLAAKGYVINRIITTQRVISILALNAIMKARVGHIRVTSPTDNSVVNQAHGRASLEQINHQLQSDGLPPIQRYDLQYRTNTSYGKFLASNSASDNYVAGEVMVLVCTTGRDQTIDRADLEPLRIKNTVGYAGIGRAAGQAGPGRVIRTQAFENKPPRIEGESWQASAPVIQDPEAIAVIKGIA